MSKNAIAIIIIVVVVILGGVLAWYFVSEDTNTNTNSSTTKNENKTTTPSTYDADIEMAPAGTVWITEGNFDPSIITISAGESVTWVNKDVSARQVAADPYPSSSSLPELKSEQLNQGETYSFTFDEVGEFTYHDDLNPARSGKVIVE